MDVAAGELGAQVCAMDSAAKAYCWGDNQYGQLGDGNTTDSSVPADVDASGVLAGKIITQMTVGGTNTCAVDISGAAYCWGGSGLGALGDGSTAGSEGPVLVGPQAPADLTAIPAATSVALTWDVPVGLDGGAVTGYTATASPGGQTCGTSGATTCIITGLASQANYSITVVAHTTVGDSGASQPAVVTTGSGQIVSGYRKSKCVDDSGGSKVNDTKIMMWDCNGTAQQSWTIQADGTIQIYGRCMDIYRDRKTNNSPVELWTCTDGANQRWHPRNRTLVNPVSGKCLDDPGFKTTNGTQLEIYTCNGGANQQWKLP
jgi:hypothetical protein